MPSQGPEPDEPVAELTGLRVETGGRAIVDGVTLRVLPGQVVALVGPSGSGKTTTALALLGEHPPGARVSGTVRIAGDGAVGYIPQHPGAALNPARQVGALLHDIARRQGGTRAERTERIIDAMRLAQLPDPDELLERFPHQLSGGQQQRVVLAQVLLLGARLVIADEPTTGQDALTKRRIVAELTAVKEQGTALLILSHDLGAVRELADLVVVMCEGRVVASGSPDEVLDAPEPPPVVESSDGPGAAGRLQARVLSAWHGGRRHGTEVLRDVSLTVGAGECLAVVGRSGSGKTTLARCLAGLHRRWSGSVLLDGDPLPRSLRSRDRHQLAGVQYVFQDARSAFDEFRAVHEQVARTAVRLRGLAAREARAQALRLLGEMGLGEETARRRPGALSGGELQRAALARALLARPRVLVCDEVTSGLDPAAQRGILDLLGQVREPGGEYGGTSLVLITHDLTVAAELADRIAVLDAGRLVEEGRAADVLTTPAHAFTRELLAACRPVAAR